MLKKLILIFILISGISYSLTAQEFKNEFSVISDNDAYLWYGQDRYYTNGLFVNYRRAKQSTESSKIEKRIYGISFGQKMYNPISGYSPNPLYHDRPFAAYLYGAPSLSLYYKNEQILKADLEVGVIGPKALGKQTQTLLHKIVGFYEISGWEYQIGNDIGLNANLNYIKLITRDDKKSVDLSLDSYLRLGTTFDAIGLGVMFRAGKINSLPYSAIYSARTGKQEEHKKEVFFYAKPQLNYVTYDATIEGSISKHNSPITYNVKPWVFSQLVGFNYSTPHLTIDYHLIFNSKEIKSWAKAHQYGSIGLAYRF